MNINVLFDPYRPHPSNWVKEINAQLPAVVAQPWAAVPWSANVVKSISMSHKHIVRMARLAGVEEVFIVEEDVMFTSPDSVRYFLENKPNDYDLYLGGCYGLNQLAKERIEKAGPGAHAIHNFTGLHCYIIHSRYFDKFLSLPEDQHIDNQPGMGQFYVCYPFIALQHPGWSANNRLKVDYNTTISENFKYHGQGT